MSLWESWVKGQPEETISTIHYIYSEIVYCNDESYDLKVGVEDIEGKHYILRYDT